MRYASAMFYGGELIAAANADYDSFKNLGLLCPICKEGVFLQAISQRQQGDKLITVPAHFKHFKAKDPALAKLCEARVAKYDATEIQRSAARARNQRLRLLQRRFWGICSRYYEQIEFPITSILESDGQQDFMLEMGHFFSNVFLLEKQERFKHLVRQMLEAGYTNTHVMLSWDPKCVDIGVSVSTAIQYHFRESLSGKLDRQMQELIACEVLEFLHSKSSRPLVEKLFTLASCVILDAMGDGARLGLIGGDGEDWVTRSPEGKGVSETFWAIPKNREIFYHYAYSHVCLWLAMLPWARQMQLEKSR